MDVSQSVATFDQFFEQSNGRNERSIKSIILSVLSFYETEQAEGLVNDDGDMLLFQYGAYDWGFGEFFEITLTRQFIEVKRHDDEHVMSQFHLSCFLEPTEDLKALGNGQRWCNQPSQLHDFTAWLMQHPILAVAEGLPRKKTEVSWELV